MAADGYLKAAAAQLQSAAQAVKMEIDRLRSNAKTSEHDLQRDIDKNESEIRALSGRMLAPNEPQENVALSAQMQRLKSQNDDRKKQLNEIQSRTTQAIQAKENAMNDVMNEARTLEAKAGNPALK